MTQTAREHFEGRVLKFKQALDALKEERTPNVLDRFRVDPRNYYAVCYLFVIAIEAMVDIGQYLLVSRNTRAEGQRDVFRLLARERIIPDDLAERLQNVLGFRNILIHVYPNLDDAKVAAYLKDNLGDFDAFLNAMQRAMDA